MKKTKESGVATKSDINDLAAMISRGFDTIEGRISEVDERLSGKVDGMEKNLNDFRIEVKNEFRQVTGILVKNHEERIAALERKTGLHA